MERGKFSFVNAKFNFFTRQKRDGAEEEEEELNVNQIELNFIFIRPGRFQLINWFSISNWTFAADGTDRNRKIQRFFLSYVFFVVDSELAVFDILR